MNGGAGVYLLSTSQSTSIETLSVANSSVFAPEAGLRYNFTVEYGTKTVNTRTYHTSAWLGAFNLGSGTNYDQGTPVVVGQPTVLASSLYFYVDASNENTPYIYQNTSVTTNDPVYKPTQNWTTSTWYGKKTYYEQAQETVDTTHIADTSIKADLPIMVQFTGSTTAGITINSPYSSVTILGNLENVTGTTSITAGGSITAPKPNTTIEGVDVVLQAGNGSIGTSSQPINVVLASGSNAALTATTSKGSIYIDSLTSENLAINTVSAGGDQTVSLTAAGSITVAQNGAGTITGGTVTLNAQDGGNVGSSNAYLKLDVGQNAADKLTLTAGGDVYIEQTEGNLPLFALTSGGDVYIDVDNGSLTNVNTNVEQDPRTVADLESGEWTALQLTNTTGAQAKIQSTENEYTLSQDALYQTYWTDQGELVDGSIQFSQATIAYYTSVYTPEAQATYGSSDPTRQTDINNYVAGQISTLELAATQQYYSLAAIFGPGGSYAPGTNNVFDAATGSDVTVTATQGTLASSAVTFGNSGANGTITLTGQGSWAALGYAVGNGIYIEGSTGNGNGASFGGTNYYTIGAINGATVTLDQALAVTGAATVSLAPVTVTTTAPTTTTTASQNGSLTNATVNFGNSGNSGTITLTSGTWGSNYQVGQGIFVGSATDLNANGTAFSASATNPYYTITGISQDGKTLTLSNPLIGENNAAVQVAAVSIVTTQGSATLVNYNSYVYNPNFTYLLTQPEVQSLTGNIKVWSQSQLLAGISAGLLQTTTSTEVNIVDASTANITANAVYLTVNQGNGTSGNIGSLVNPVTAGGGFSSSADQVGFVVGTSINNTPVQLALAAAQLSDMNFLAAIPQVETVNFNGSSMTLANGASWASTGLGIAVGNYLYIGGSTQNATQNGNYYLVSGFSGSNDQTVELTLTHGASAIQNETLTFGDTGNSGTITLAGNATWGGIGYTAGSGIYIQGNDVNANGTGAFNPSAQNPYYTISSISADGKTITLNSGQMLVAQSNVALGVASVSLSSNLVTETSQSVLVAPVVTDLSSHDDSTAGALTSQTVTFGDSGNSGTVTLTGPGNATWTSLGYAPNEGIFIQGTDTNANGSGSFDPTASNGYYTISAISADGKTLTLDWGQILTTEGSKSVNVAPVTINIKSGVDNVKFVLISQDTAVGILPNSATTPLVLQASATGFVNLDSGYGDNLALTNVVSTSGGDVSVKTQGEILNDASSGVNLQGGNIVLEAGQGYIGTATNAVTVDIDSGGSLTARALDDIYITVPSGNLPIEGIYSADGGVSLLTDDGSIFDAILSDFDKIQANWLELQADGSGSSIGGYVDGDGVYHAPTFGTGDKSLAGTVTSDALHVYITSGSESPFDGTLRVMASGSIDVDQTTGDLDVLDAYSSTGDVMLEAAGNIVGGNLSNPTTFANSTPLTTDALASVYARNVFLDAGLGGGLGGIGTGALTPFNIVSSFSGGNDSGMVTALAANQDIYLDEVASTLVPANNGDIQLVSVSTGTGLQGDPVPIAFITSLTGNILNARPDNDAIVVSGMADFIAQLSVGQSGNRSNGFSGRIVSTTGNLEADAITGDIWLWNIGALIVGGVVPVATTPFALWAKDGQIHIQTSSPLEISENISDAGDVVEQAGQSAEDDDNLTIDSGVSITSSGGSITLGAGNNVTVDSTAVLNAHTFIAIDSGDYDTSSTTDTDNITIDSEASLTAGTSITLNSADNITIGAATLTANGAGGIALNAGTYYTGTNVPTPGSNSITTAVATPNDAFNNVDVQDGADLWAKAATIAISAPDNITLGAADLMADTSITLNAGNQARSVAASDDTTNNISIGAGADLQAGTSIGVNAANAVTISGGAGDDATTLTATSGNVAIHAGDLSTYSSLSSDTAGDSVTIGAGVTITSTDASILVDAGNNITLDGSVLTGGVVTVAGAVLSAGTAITLDAGDFDTSDVALGRADDLAIQSGASLTAGTTQLPGTGSITLDAANSIIVGAAALMADTGNITFNAGNQTTSAVGTDGTTNNVVVGSGATLEAGSAIAINAADIAIGAANLTANTSITLDAGNPDNTVAALGDENLTLEAGSSLRSLTASITLEAANNVWLQGVGATAAKLEAVTGVTLVAGLFDTASIAATPIDAMVNFTVNALGQLTTMTLANGTDWSGSFVAGDKILIGSVPGGTSSDLTPGENYLTIASVSGSTITFVPQTSPNTDVRFTDDINKAVAITIDPATPIAATVSFAETSGVSTMTLSTGTWAGTGLVVGDDILIAGSADNSTPGDQYLQIAAINGGVITFAAGESVVGGLGNENVKLGTVLRDVRIDAGVVIDTTNAPAVNQGTAQAPDYVASGGPADSSAAITIDSSESVNISGTAGIYAAPQLIAPGAITINAGYLSGAATPGFGTANVTVDLFGTYKSSTMTVTTGSGDDDIEFSPASMAVTGATMIDSGAGDDLIHVYNLPVGITTLDTIDGSAGQIADTINLDGQDGGDTYQIDATANSDYVINVNDSGAFSSGLNYLIINGAYTEQGQTFLVRDGFVAILESAGSAVYQRINYNDTITGGLEINGGNVDVSNANPMANGNSFYLDGNSAVTTINAGNGDDFFQVGQVYATTAIGSLAGDVGAGIGDGLTTTLTTVGYLSDGVDKSTVLYGGAGTDTFEVYSNKADLAMIGGSGDDTFIVRAFLVAAGTHIGVTGGSGNDTIEYNVNAPVDIEGGTGFNTLVLLGTEANDTFVITSTGIFGGGLDIAYTNIQAITIDGLEGNDTFYVLSTPYDVVTTINGGDGGDTVVVGGDVTGAVISANSQGASSVTDNTVNSRDPEYNNTFVAGVSVAVGGSGGSIIGQPTQAIVHVNDPNSLTYMTVSAPTGLGSGEIAYVNVTPTLPSAEWGSQGAASLLVSVDGGLTWAANAILKFVGGVTQTQTVLLKAAPTDGTYTRNETIVVASSIISNDPALNALVLPTVKVTLETGTAGLIIDQGLKSTSVVDGQNVTTYNPQANTIVAGQTTYTYYLAYNQQLTGSETVTYNLSATDGQGNLNTAIGLSQNNGIASSQTTVTFNSTNWNVPVAITVTAMTNPGEAQQNVDIVQTTLVHNTTTNQDVLTDAGDVNLTVAAQVPGVAVLAPAGGAEVSSNGQTYTYQLALTAAPTSNVTVGILGDGQTYATSTAAGFNSPVFNATGPHPYYQIAGINNNVLTLAAGTVLTNETAAMVDLALVSIDAQTPGNSTAGTPVSEPVSFSYVNGVATVTLTNGTNWASLGFTGAANQGLFVGARTDANSNGSVFNAAAPTPYYQSAAIKGSVLTLASGTVLTNETGVVVNIAPVAINGQNPANSTAGAIISEMVNFSYVGGVATVTLANGATWASLGFTGASSQGLFVGAATDVNSSNYQTLTFTPANWNTPVSITLNANPNYVAPKDGNQGSNPATDMSFPNQPHTLKQLYGPLIIDGGTQPGQPALVSAVALPYETNNPAITEQTLQGEGVGEGAIDVVKIYDDGATAGETGTLSSIPAADEFGTPLPGQGVSGYGVNIGGLDMPTQSGAGGISYTNKTTGITTTYENGIDVVNVDAIEVFLGKYNDTFTIDTDHPTVNVDDGLQTTMVIEGGGGSNTITVTASSDPLVLYGNTSASGVEYNSLPGAITGNAYSFTSSGSSTDPYGSDVIYAKGATGTVIIVGGPDNDTLTGGSGINWIAGGEGNDVIAASGTENYIFGDSSFTFGGLVASATGNSQTLDLSSRLLTIDNSLLLMDQFVNGGVQSAGADTITVTGNGASYVFGDYATVSIASQASPGVVDPFSSLGHEVFTEMASVNTALGGDDVIKVNNVNSSDVVIGGAGNDKIILGSGGQNVVLGDNGEIDYGNSSQVLSGILTDVSFGNAAGAGTITLTNGGNWASLGYAVGEGIFIGSPSDPNHNGNGSTFSATATNPYYTIASIDGATLTLGQALTAEVAATVSLSPVAIDPIHSANSSLGAIPTLVSFGNVGTGPTEAGTITQIDGESWAALGYAVGAGIFVDSPTNSNSNGTTFNPTAANAYYTIAAINGATLTLMAGQVLTPENLATVGLSPVAIGTNGSTSTLTGVSTQGKSLTSIESTDSADGGNDVISGVWAAGTFVSTQVTFGNSAGAGTITLATGTWQSAGYAVGQGIYIAGTGINGNGVTFNGDNYYTIASINGATLTLAAGQSLTTSNGAMMVNLAQVTPTPAGAGNNIIIGGVGSDTIDIGGTNNTVIGDDGQAIYDGTTGHLTSISTTDPSVGGADFINVTGGGNAILGGFGADQITIGGGGNVVLGDNGYATFTSAGVLTYITTTDQTLGGDDVIQVNGSGNNEILGGSGADQITVTGTGSNVIFGDNGDASFNATTGSLIKIETIGEISAASGNTPSVESDTSGTIYGGDDTISVGAGNNVIVGGFGADTITTGSGNAIVLGDSGTAIFDPSTGSLVSIFSTYGSATPNSTNADSGTSSNDVITLGNGNNVVIGGGGGDTIVVGATGANVIIGDDGEADYTNGILTTIFSTDDTVGGNDSITGPTVNGVPSFGGSGNNVVIGGIGSDTIKLGGAGNTVIGDDGKATFGTSGQILTITTQDPTFGGADTITVNGGNNVIFGGTGGDTITVTQPSAGNVIVGDDGDATFTSEPVSSLVATSVLTYIETTNQTDGGDDIITTGAGNNVIFGGSGADRITVGTGNSVILGDNGNATFAVALASGSVAAGDASYARTLTQIETTAETSVAGVTSEVTTGGTVYGGDDTITVGDGNNVILGGFGADTITTGNGNNIVLGDSGTANFSATTAQLINIFSTYGSATPNSIDPDNGTSSNDLITLGNGNNVVIGGGGGGDTIIVGATGANVIIGDDGEADYTNGILTTIFSTDDTVGGNDSITGPTVSGVPSFGGSGNNVVIGGIGSDTIKLGGAGNTVIGDDGKATFGTSGQILTITTQDPTFGGGDTITVNGGNNVIFGGTGGDTITVTQPSAGNVIVGDDGDATFTSEPVSSLVATSVLTYIETTNQTDGGDDIITTGAGNNVIFGGSGADRITVGTGNSVILGDNGNATFAVALASGSVAAGDASYARTLTQIETTAETSVAGVTSEVTTGGTVYGGDDTITVGDGNNVILGGFGADTITTGNGNNIVLGDSGTANFSAMTAQLINIFSTYGSATPNSIDPDDGTSSNDVITLGNGNNVVIGGGGGDTIIVGATGANVIIGDDGRADYTNGILTTIFSTDDTVGGNDSITGPTVNGVPSFGGSGNNVVIGGIGSDTIKLGGAGNTVIGDDGKATFGTSGQILTVTTQDPTFGGGDTITVNGGNNVILGGTGGDTITVQGPSSGNVILGDDGDATFASEPVSNSVATSILTFIETTSQTDGGNDTISTGDGNNVILGGSGADQITVGNGNSVILGDNGNATFVVALATGSVAAGNASYSRTLTNIETTAEVAGVETAVQTTANAIVYGGNDRIVAGNGNNVIFGGLGADNITAGDGANIILGDSGIANFDAISGVLVSIATTFAGAPVGGTVATGTSSDDIITAGIDNFRDGNNVVFGGDGNDQITTGSGTDIILGDNGYADFAVVAGILTPSLIECTYSTIGGNDVIYAGGGNDIVFGETGNDTIDGGTGNDTIFGDFASYDASRVANARFLSAFTGAADGGGNDTIYGGPGSNYLVGGQGNDTIYGDEPLGNALNAQAGDNDIIGDNNTPGGAVGNDAIYAYGSGNNVILGDNGQIYRTVLLDNWQNMVWATDPAPYNDIIRQVATYDELIGGNDTIVSGDGMDRIFGQAGNDTIVDGNGSDEIIGGLGSNNITVGSGNDTVLAGEGQIFRALNPDGTAVLNSDGSWHRDVLLEQVGAITGSVDIDSAGNAIQPNLAAELLNADMILLGGSFQSDGSQLINSDDNSWQAEALLVSLEPVSGSTVTAGSGDDDIFGTLGNDTITAGNGNDVIFGDRASNTVTYATDIPHIINGVLIVGDTSTTSFNIPSDGQGDLVTPAVNLLPSALTPNTPQIELAPSAGAGSLQSMVQSGNLVEPNGTVVQVFASIVPDLIHNKDALPGNDTITVGNGNDVIFGDDGVIGALPTTGISAIDAQLQGLSVTMLGVLNQLSALSTAQDALEVAEGISVTPFTVFAGNDHITVGNGNDTVFGDEGEYLVPGVAFAQGSGSLASNAVALDTYLLDMQEVFGDLSYVVNEAGQQVINSYSAPASRPATHLLELGNDVITDGSGSDLVVGDNGIVIMPGVGTATPNWATGVSASTLQSVQQQLAQLEASFNASLTAQFNADHPFTANNGAAAQNLFNGGAGFDLYIGNDNISGGSGNSILIGDTALILDPVIAPGSNGASDADALQSTMVTAVDRLFLGSYSSASATAESWGVVANLAASGATNWSSAGGYVFNDPSKSNITLGSDTINSGNGSDHIYGDMGVLLPILGTTPGAATGFYAYPVGETGETQTANFNYVYGFGPFGALHQWTTAPTSPSTYAVDADTVTGGAGNNVIFGELGDDSITGGSGNDQISGGYGFNTVSGGGGQNSVVFNRTTDTHVASGGGNDVARSSLNTAAASSILQVSWQSIVGNTLAAGMITPAPGPVKWTGVVNATTTYPVPSLPIVIEADGTTELVQIGDNYFLENISGGNGPELTIGGVAVMTGQYGTYAPIAAEKTASGYDVAFKAAGSDQYSVWSVDSNGNYITNLVGIASGTSTALESIETAFHQDLNGDGVIGVATTVIETDGTTELVQIGNNYFLESVSGGNGPELTIGGVAVVTGQYGTYAPIAAVQTASGYDVAFKAAGSDQYSVWSVDSKGNYITNLVGIASGTSTALESTEVAFDRDLNGDGVIGVATTVIETDGTTELVQIGNNYFLESVSGGNGPELTIGGVAVVTGQYGTYAPIAAVQTASGYDVAFKAAGSDQYSVWSVDSNGNYITNLVGIASGTSTALESIETAFDRDLNGDGVIGIPTTVIETDGTTELVQIGNNYFLESISGGKGPELTIGGVAVVSGQYGTYAPIAAVQTASGYDVAFKALGSDQYSVWSVDSNGNYITNLVGIASGTSTAIESTEVAFDRDLNSDGVIGIPTTVIEADGATELVQIGNNYFLESISGGNGPELTIGSVAVVTGQYGTYAPIAAEKTASGYDVAFESAGSDLYSVWSVDSNGNYITNLVGIASGGSSAVESLEGSFYQDLNGDGYIGSPSTVIEASGSVAIAVTPFAQAATIDGGSTLELTGAASGSVTFNATTGTLVLDHSQAFTGQVIGLSGNGNVATSDVLDLRDIAPVGAMESYSGNTSSGILTVSDNQGHVAHISLVGDYTNSTFTLSSDGKGGTFVVDPPIAQASTGVPATGTNASPIVGSSLPIGSAGAFNVTTSAAAPNFSMDLDPITRNVIQAPSPIVAEGVPNRTLGSSNVMATAGRPANTVEHDDETGQRPIAGPGASGIALVEGEQPQQTAAVSSGAVAREVISPNEVIRAINGGNIALRFGNAPDRRIWLFDEAEGDFVPPASQPLTIMIDRDSAPASSLQSVDEAAGLLATAAMISNQPTWLGTLRQFRRKAAGALGIKWTE